MRLFGLLDLSRSALGAHQVGIRTAGHNIANATTPGYSRQRVDFEAAEPHPAPRGFSMGGGVRAESLRGLRDLFVERQILAEESALATEEAQRRPLAQVDALLNEMGGEGLHSSLDRLFNAFRDLAAHPESTAHREEVLAAADSFAYRMRQAADGAHAIQSQLDDEVGSHVDAVNDLSKQIADLNGRIAAVEAGGQEASDLRDRRQLALREIAQHISVNVFEDEDSRVMVMGPGGRPLVEHDSYFRLEVRRPEVDPGADPAERDTWLRVFHVSGTGREPVDITDGIRGATDQEIADWLAGDETPEDPSGGGALQGILYARDVTLQTLRDRLDEFAFGFVEAVNQVHRQGVDRTGNPGEDFFSPLNGQEGAAGDIGLALTRADRIAAAKSGDPDNPAAGDNRNALDLAHLQSDPLFGAATPGERMSWIVRDVGAWAAENEYRLEFQTLKLDQLDSLREARSGVSLDEEMLDMIKLQNAFSASAKVIQSVDEMLTTVMQLKQ